jgi:hypothetical protein
MFVRPRLTLPRKRKQGAYRLFAMSALVMSTALAGRPALAQQVQSSAAQEVGGLRVGGLHDGARVGTGVGRTLVPGYAATAAHRIEMPVRNS